MPAPPGHRSSADRRAGRPDAAPIGWLVVAAGGIARTIWGAGTFAEHLAVDAVRLVTTTDALVHTGSAAIPTGRVAGTGPTGTVPPMVPELIYDGDCGFCTRCARWIEGRWAPGAARAVAAATRTDGELRAVGLTRVDVEEAAWWIDADGTAHRGERAIAAALGESRGWPRWAGRALTRVPLRWLAPIAYRTVARHRHRLPGATSACAPGSRIA